MTKHLNFRISGQKINNVNETKYLSIYLDEHLTWNFQLNKIKTKLSRSCGLLAKLRYHVKTELLWTLYFAIFDAVLRYAVQVWSNTGIKQLKREKNFKKMLLELCLLRGETTLLIHSSKN